MCFVESSRFDTNLKQEPLFLIFSLLILLSISPRRSLTDFFFIIIFAVVDKATITKLAAM